MYWAIRPWKLLSRNIATLDIYSSVPTKEGYVSQPRWIHGDYSSSNLRLTTKKQKDTTLKYRSTHLSTEFGWTFSLGWVWANSHTQRMCVTSVSSFGERREYSSEATPMDQQKGTCHHRGPKKGISAFGARSKCSCGPPFPDIVSATSRFWDPA